MFHPFPSIPKDLLEALEKRFPERSPTPRDDYGELMARAGEATVVRFLRRTFDEQNETVLAMQDPDVLRL